MEPTQIGANRWILLAAVNVAFSLAAQDEAAAQRPDTVQSAKVESVLLVIDEQNIRDIDRARLAQLIAKATPQSFWHSVKVPPNTGKEQFVNTVFRYYGSDYPETTLALIRSIEQANGLVGQGMNWAGKRLLVPPFPVRGYQRYKFGEGEVRVYDVASGAYGMASQSRDPKAFAALFGDTTVDPEREPVSTDDKSVVRAGNVTVLSMPVTAALLALADSAGDQLLPAGVMALTPGGFIQIELFSGDTSSCNEAADWLKESPYLPLLRQHLASLSAAEKDSIVQRAARSTLMVVDWDVEHVSRGHGSKVVSVAESVLNFLGLAAFSQNIRKVDLNPYSQRTRAKELLNDYQLYLLRQGQLVDVNALFGSAKAWLDTAKAPAASRTYVIPEFILRAQLWNAFRRDSLWANLSFTVPNPSFTLQPPDLARRQASFGIVAAGNAPVGLDPLATLQNVASFQPNLVNVTSGTRAGVVLGTYSNPSQRMVVSLVAPGCGFQYGTIVPADSGSSYASPYVAAAAWASHLIGGIPLSRMRNLLIFATRQVPDMIMPVESNGIFDPALLLTLPSLRTHIVNAAGEMTMVDSLSLDVRIGGAETITTVHVDRLTNDMPTRSFSIYRCNGVFCALYQSISNNALSTSRGKILSVRIRWVANGQVRELLTPDAAAGAVRTVMF